MKMQGHNLLVMHESVISALGARSTTQTEFVRGLLAEVEGDHVLQPILTALDVYGRVGRF